MYTFQKRFMGDLLYWIELDFTGVPNEVAGDCTYRIHMWTSGAILGSDL